MSKKVAKPSESNKLATKFMNSVIALANDPARLDKMTKELATPQSQNVSRTYTKSKNNQSDILRAATVDLIPDSYDLPKRNSVWMEIIDIIEALQKDIVYGNYPLILPFVKALKVIIDANSKASLSWKEQTAKKVRYAITNTNTATAVRKSPFWVLLKDFEFRADTEKRSSAYKTYKKDIGHVTIPYSRVLNAIKELYQKGMNERGIPDMWQQYMFCALQLASGLRKPEILNYNTTNAAGIDGKEVIVTDWIIKSDLERKNAIRVVGVAKKKDDTKAVNIIRPLVGLDSKQFVVGLNKIRPLVEHLTTERKDSKTAKEQNAELEKDPQWNGLNKIWKQYFPEVFAHIEAYKDPSGVKRGIKNLGRQVYAGAAFYLSGLPDVDRVSWVNDTFAHDTVGSSVNYLLVIVVKDPADNTISEAAKSLPDCKECKDLVKELQLTKQENKTNASELAAIKRELNDLRQLLTRKREKADKTEEAKADRKQQFMEVVNALEQKNEDITVQSVMDAMKWKSKDKVAEWLRQEREKIRSRAQPKVKPRNLVAED